MTSRSSTLAAAIRVLVVEDEPLQRFSMENTLAEMGSTAVFGAGTEEQALAVIASERIDVAILDVHLDDRTSFQLAQILASRNVPIVFLTGSQGEEIPESFRGRPFVAKPFADDLLLGAMLSALESARGVGLKRSS